MQKINITLTPVVQFICDHEHANMQVRVVDGDVVRKNGFWHARVLFRGVPFTHIDGCETSEEAERLLHETLEKGAYLA